MSTCEFCEIFKKTFFKRTPPVDTSVNKNYDLNLFRTERDMKIGLQKGNYNEKKLSKDPSTN